MLFCITWLVQQTWLRISCHKRAAHILYLRDSNIGEVLSVYVAVSYSKNGMLKVSGTCCGQQLNMFSRV